MTGIIRRRAYFFIKGNFVFTSNSILLGRRMIHLHRKIDFSNPILTFGVAIEFEHDTTRPLAPFVFKANKFTSQICFLRLICYRIELRQRKMGKLEIEKKGENRIMKEY